MSFVQPRQNMVIMQCQAIKLASRRCFVLIYLGTFINMAKMFTFRQ
jgi:hypothetical protein